MFVGATTVDRTFAMITIGITAICKFLGEFEVGALNMIGHVLSKSAGSYSLVFELARFR